MPPKVRKAPIRTCVVCRKPQPKKMLVRLVRTPAGEVVLDPTGRASGRGAYVCSRLECRSGPDVQRQLSRALGVPAPGGLFGSV